MFFVELVGHSTNAADLLEEFDNMDFDVGAGGL